MMFQTYRLNARLIFRLDKAGFRGLQRKTILSVEMRQTNDKKGQSGAAHTFSSDGTKVLDRGVWKQYKYCKNCKKIMVMRKSWEKNWDSVAVCSDKCRKAARSKRENTPE